MKMKKFNPRNDIFHNWNKDLYIATKKQVIIDDYNNEIVEYNAPFYFGKVNYQPMTWRELQSYMSAFGETKRNIVGALIDYKDKDKFDVFDLAYLYGRTPKGETINGSNANYIVKSFKPQNTRIMVVFEEIIEDNVEEES